MAVVPLLRQVRWSINCLGTLGAKPSAVRQSPPPLTLPVDVGWLNVGWLAGLSWKNRDAEQDKKSLSSSFIEKKIVVQQEKTSGKARAVDNTLGDR